MTAPGRDRFSLMILSKGDDERYAATRVWDIHFAVETRMVVRRTLRFFRKVQATPCHTVVPQRRAER